MTTATTCFSVVIPTFHRNEHLARALECLAPGRQLDMTISSEPVEGDAATYEVIVSDAGVETTAEEMIRTKFAWVRWTPCPGAGPAANRNNGARQASGEWFAFVDDDCLPTPGWLKALSVSARDRTVDVIEGKIVAPDKADNIFRHAVDNLTGDSYWSANLAVRRDVFNRLGRFDEDFRDACCEDVEFADRIRRSSVRATFCAAGIVLHPCHVVTLRYALRRTFRIRWHLLYMHKTGRAVPPTAPTWKALAHVVVHRTRSLLSVTRRIGRHYPGRPCTALFNLTIEWLTFPIVVPYLIFWELRFRGLLKAGRLQPARS